MNKTPLAGLILLILLQSSLSINITDETITSEELISRVTKFNNFYHTLNPSTSNLELKIDTKGRVSLFSKADLSEGDTYASVTKEQMISTDFIYSTKYGETLSEKFNPEGKWKTYVDILPAKVNNLSFDFWNRKQWAEPLLVGTGLISKLF